MTTVYDRRGRILVFSVGIGAIVSETPVFSDRIDDHSIGSHRRPTQYDTAIYSLVLLMAVFIILLMRDPISVFKYLIGSIVGNGVALIRAGANKTSWGTIGGAIVGGILGSSIPIVGTILGFLVGGLLGAGLNYAVS